MVEDEMKGVTSDAQADFNERIIQLKPKLEALLAEYGISLGAKMNYLTDAVIPTPVFVDAKGQKELSA